MIIYLSRHIQPLDTAPAGGGGFGHVVGKCQRMPLHLRYSASTHRGYQRENNEDSVYAGPRLLALADGMGGHAAGEVASSLVIAELAPLDERDPGEDVIAELRDAVGRANAAVRRHVEDNPDLDGMGTTLTALLFAGDTVGLVHVGDSRAYLLRDGSLQQITKDETMAQALIDEGRLDPEEARSHPGQALVLRALTGRELQPVLQKREVKAGDRYLLCSDGVSDVLSPDALADALLIEDPQRCAFELLPLAMRAGTRDNVTCIVADVTERDFGYNVPIVGGAASLDPAPS
jgi:serine/threonine protein phosphatase PrpC